MPGILSKTTFMISSREFLADNICISENSGMEVISTLTKKTKIKQNLEEIENRIENYKRFEQMKSTLKIQKEELYSLIILMNQLNCIYIINYY